MKACTRCHEVKTFPEFRPNPKMKLGWDSWCKACCSSHKAAKRRERISQAKITPANKTCYKCKDEKFSTEFAVERGNKDGLSGICRACRSAKHFAYFSKDPDGWRERARQAEVKRRGNSSFVVHKRVSARVGEWLGTLRGGKRTFDLLGYTLPELRDHLERQFLRGMSWENMGEWHIDHIVPLSSFTVTGPDDPELRRAWALSNLRPLWAKDNIAKGAKRVALI